MTHDMTRELSPNGMLPCQRDGPHNQLSFKILHTQVRVYTAFRVYRDYASKCHERCNGDWYCIALYKPLELLLYNTHISALDPKHHESLNDDCYCVDRQTPSNPWASITRTHSAIILNIIFTTLVIEVLLKMRQFVKIIELQRERKAHTHVQRAFYTECDDVEQILHYTLWLVDEFKVGRFLCPNFTQNYMP